MSQGSSAQAAPATLQSAAERAVKVAGNRSVHASPPARSARDAVPDRARRRRRARFPLRATRPPNNGKPTSGARTQTSKHDRSTPLLEPAKSEIEWGKSRFLGFLISHASINLRQL